MSKLASLTRRGLLKGGLGAGALIAARPWTSFASGMSPLDERPAPRRSRLYPGTALVHADLHNHSHLSDGRGAPEHAFASMRDAGLDVAALTDHATVSRGIEHNHCGAVDGPPSHGESLECRSSAGLDERGWQRTAVLADAADEPGRFTALRGFEWSSPTLGHINVWYSSHWTDPLRTAGMDTGSLRRAMENRPWLEAIIGGRVDRLASVDVDRIGMEEFYDWLIADPADGGGRDGLACFNHPGREPGRFAEFRPDPRLVDRMVAMEILNRERDYLFRGYPHRPSPLSQCLDNGWRVGLIGVTDEHGTKWGHLQGLGRAGLWLFDHDRGGVRAALRRRHVFATFRRGLRVDVAARSHTQPPHRRARMGGTLPHRNGPVAFAVDIDRGEDWWGRPIEIQVLRHGHRYPSVVHVEEAVVRRPDEPLITFSVPLDAEDGDWVVLRIADPGDRNETPGPEGHPCNNAVIAYASPVWLDPGA